MANLNKVMIIGNLTRDPEVRYTPKGTAVADLGIAVNRQWTNEAGEKQEEVTFIGVTLWGRQAELAQQYLAKGRSVYIEGRLTQESWDDKETGKKQTKTKVVGEHMQFLGGNGEKQPRDESAPPPERRQRAAAPPQRDNSATDGPEEDDIPFAPIRTISIY